MAFLLLHAFSPASLGALISIFNTSVYSTVNMFDFSTHSRKLIRLFKVCEAHWAETSDPSHYLIPHDWVTTYTYPTNWHVQDCFSICQWCPPNLAGRKLSQATDHILVQSTGWESNPQAETHNIRPDPLSQWTFPP
jgi:hypothetical protein